MELDIEMMIDIGYILGHLCEFTLFLYYTNMSFYPRKSYTQSNIISLAGYAFLFVVGLLGYAWINLLLFFIINAILLMYCYNIKLKNAAFYSLVLNAFSAIGEYIILYIMGVRYTSKWIMGDVSVYESLAILLGAKSIYLIGIIFLKRFTNKKTIYNSNSEMVLIAVPLLTIICLTLMMKFDMNQYMFLLICIALFLVNFITFYINVMLNEKNTKIKLLQEEYDQNRADLSEYEILSEKYENTKIMRHDIHKQIKVLKDLIAEDDAEAKKYLQQIQFLQSELNYSKYTDNKILNILLEQKVKECHEHGIEIHINSTAPKLSFISDVDIVAIFSNMLDNAIEASENSEKKEIFVDLYTVNNSFSAVKIENYTDKEPVILDGALRTQKKNSDIHGIGIKSINNALKKYGSQLNWTYDENNKFFSAMFVIHVSQNEKLTI